VNGWKKNCANDEHPMNTQSKVSGLKSKVGERPLGSSSRITKPAAPELAAKAGHASRITHHASRLAFTLIELLVVIAIIAILAR